MKVYFLVMNSKRCIDISVYTESIFKIYASTRWLIFTDDIFIVCDTCASISLAYNATLVCKNVYERNLKKLQFTTQRFDTPVTRP